jgi:very-short-patch-repair endonuclease
MGSNIKSKARALRRNMTDAERALWNHLRLRQMQGFKFRRQQPIGNYIVDFVSFDQKLIIELDGGQHVSQASYDRARTAWLEKQGFEVLRFWDNQVLTEMEGVKQVIWNKLTPHLTSPHRRGEENSRKSNP